MCIPNIHSLFHTFIDYFFLFSFLEINIFLSSFNHKPASSLNCIFPPGSVLVLNCLSGNSRRCSSESQLSVNKCLCPLLSSLHRQKPRAFLPRYLPHALASWPSPLPSSLFLNGSPKEHNPPPLSKELPPWLSCAHQTGCPPV